MPDKQQKTSINQTDEGLATTYELARDELRRISEEPALPDELATRWANAVKKLAGQTGAAEGPSDRQPAPSSGETLPVSISRRIRGFAVMDKDRQRQIASDRDRTAHSRAQGHKFTAEEARTAGRQVDRAAMVTISRQGATAREITEDRAYTKR